MDIVVVAKIEKINQITTRLVKVGGLRRFARYCTSIHDPEASRY